MALPILPDFLRDYPTWFLIACAIALIATAAWILAKVLKWAFWFILIAALLAGGALFAAAN